MAAKLSVDFDLDVAYLSLCDDPVAETEEVSPGVLVDLSAMLVVVGIEVLALDAYIPRTELIQKFHVREEHVKILDRIRPNVTTFVQRSAPEPVDTPVKQGDWVSA